MLKRVHSLTVCLAACFVLTGCDPSHSTVGYSDTAGNSGQFSDHQGQWLIINYWAIWCKPCIEEIPELNNFADKNKEQARVFSVNYDGKQDQQLIEQTEKLGITFSTLTTDPAKTLGFERPTVLPTTVILDKTGKLYRTLIGPQTQKSLEQALIQ
jgi:thiol-disulfide isomerase/thioredoxin